MTVATHVTALTVESLVPKELALKSVPTKENDMYTVNDLQKATTVTSVLATMVK